MTELTIPRDASTGEASRLVEEHVTVGDTVEVREADRTGADDVSVTGEVTGIEPGYLELDGRSPGEGSPRYDQIRTVIRIEIGTEAETEIDAGTSTDTGTDTDSDTDTDT
ncbi:hypothetical protein [Natrialba asiatica]|uniref:Uncharacterized protein n=1 Tax=Natrialba asiatica (strain ATCC 700177 / DSM 12278 / JCM 9576 / FERM P-10747 / NBRC 102637 / 172P1) TaxID=29540 RepID=M0AV58_NATA1|nr:hypothetical protein [Natrialba asiatica]ELZ02430.1 hypothetical protein C481_07166 [Natrialba asiatica DSM 12278]